MCLICVDFQREAMSLHDAQRAFGEMKTGMEPEHVKEVREMLEKAAREQAESDKD